MKAIFFVLVVVLLGACKKPTPPVTEPLGSGVDTASVGESLSDASETLKNIDQNLATTKKITTPSAVDFEVVKLDYTPPKQIMEVCVDSDTYVEGATACPIAHIELAKSTPEFIARAVNEYITGDSGSELLKFRRSLDEFFEEQLSSGGFGAYERQIGIVRLPDHRSLVQVASYDSTYAGGAHGHSSSRYHLFDMDLQSQVSLEDILLPDHELHQALQDAYTHYLADEHQMSKKDIKDHQASYPLEMTDSVYFADEGLVFSYQPYELGPYVMGGVELLLSFDQLQGSIRPQYL